jgi:DNA-binding NarL/FixJ family response regulator
MQMNFTVTEKTKVFVFSEQPLFREGIRNWLSSKPDIEIMGDTNVTNTTMLLSIQLMPPDVVIIDVDYPDSSGLDLARRLKHLLPNVKIIALKSSYEDNDLVEALKVKLSAYLDKSISGDELLNIIRRVANQESCIDENLISRPGVVKQVIGELQELSGYKEIIDVSSPLRRRETEVMSYVARGYSNKEIGAEMGISQETVKTHVASVMTKLDAKDRTEAVVKAIKHNWVEV